tara:strand:- start:2114 stop:2611 length:498 start_codon:yes stop_codon:yes gene_type:complete
MKLKLFLPLALFAILIAPSAIASIDEVGDLNIINDMANPSDGLRYLDRSFSDGLSLAHALINAQGSYANARLATPSEWDDLFAAAGITYDGAVTASDAFTALGDNQTIASGGSCCATLVSTLGGNQRGKHHLDLVRPGRLHRLINHLRFAPNVRDEFSRAVATTG